MKNRNKSLK